MGAVVEIWLYSCIVQQFAKYCWSTHVSLINRLFSNTLPWKCVASHCQFLRGQSNDGRIELTPGLVDLLCLCTRLEVLSERNW